MEQVFRYIDKNRSRLIELAKGLVSIPTVNPPGENYEKIASFIEKYCKRLGLNTRRVITPKSVLKRHKVCSGSERINLIANWDCGASKTLHINGHYDVVPVTSMWKSDPFNPVVRQGKLYGRGTEDMKANIAATLMAVESVMAGGIKPHCNIELSFTPDEETGGRTGFGYIAGKNVIKPDYGLSEGYRSEYISYGSKGLIWFKVEVKGIAAHSSEPHKGINAFEKMVKVSNELLRLNKKISGRKTRYRVKEADNRTSTMVLGGGISGGVMPNIVPDRCSFTIDRRFLPEEEMERVKREVVDAVNNLKKKDPDLKLKVVVSAEEDSAVSDESAGLFKELKSSVKKVLKKSPKCALLGGATDMRFLIRKGVPCAGYTVDGAGSSHCDNEFVYVKSLVDTTKIFADVISNIR